MKNTMKRDPEKQQEQTLSIENLFEEIVDDFLENLRRANVVF
jgi:hypothetical protein